MTRIFHLIREADLAAHLQAGGGPWSPPSLATEGFLHLSSASQIVGTLAVHFGNVDSVTLVEVDETAVEDALRWEASRDGEPFPHLYRSLEPTEVLRAWRLSRNRGEWTVPAFADDATQDVPRGDAGAPFLTNP